MLYEFDDEGDDGVNNGEVKEDTRKVGIVHLGTFEVLHDNAFEECEIEDGIGDENRHECGVFAADEGFPGELEHSGFVERPFREEGGHFSRPLLEFVTVFGSQERLFGHHNAFIVNPIDKGDDDKSEDVQSIDEQSGPDQIVGKVEWVAHHGVDALGVEVVGHLLGGVAAGCALGRGADSVGAQGETGKDQQ